MPTSHSIDVVRILVQYDNSGMAAMNAPRNLLNVSKPPRYAPLQPLLYVDLKISSARRSRLTCLTCRNPPFRAQPTAARQLTAVQPQRGLLVSERVWSDKKPQGVDSSPGRSSMPPSSRHSLTAAFFRPGRTDVAWCFRNMQPDGTDFTAAVEADPEAAAW